MSKSIYKHFLLIFLISLFVHWPSFSLHFDGDSYLTLWRFQHNTQYLSKSVLSNFFTDYGPQDSLFALIHSIFGFKPLYFFLISFFLKLGAAWSTYLLIWKLSKKTTSGLLSGLFFAVATAGIETTNWVFNMPSYLAIILLNFLMYLYSNSNRLNRKYTISTNLLFVSTILIQPIRMAFLPIYLLLDSINKYIFLKNIRHIVLSAIFIVISLLLFAFGNIGDSVGVNGNVTQKLSGEWLKTNNVNANNITNMLATGNFELLLYPIGQLGKIILPDILLEKLLAKLNINTFYLIFTETIFFILFLKTIVKGVSKSNRDFVILKLIISFWSLCVFYLFVYAHPYPLTAAQTLAFIIGGQFIVLVIILLIRSKRKKVTHSHIVSSLLLMFLGFLLFWSRNPISLLETTSRYLIIPALGYSWSLGYISSLIINNKIFKYGLFILLLLNIFSSYYYFNQLNKHRGYKETENIRRSIPTIQALSTKETTLFYFETNNNDYFYHTLYFGFPVMMYYYQDVENIWNVAYTTNWQEVVDSYKDGTGLKRFGTIQIEPVKLENVYSFNLIDNELIDTTNTTRDKLKNIK